MPEINDYVLRLTGKVSLLEEISISHNYRIVIEGSITSDELKDNQDGTFNRVYRFEPVRVGVINAEGKTLKAKDARSHSRLFRSSLWNDWKTLPNDLSDTEFYEIVLNYCIRNHTVIASQALKE